MLKTLKIFIGQRPKLVAGICVTLILSVMFFIALFSSRGAFGDPGDSAIVDEVAHIPAGYSYDKYQDYRFNPEHPPLAKALAGLPLALNPRINGPKGDSNSWSADKLNDAQWLAGWYMIYDAGNDPKEILAWSRLPMILLMIGLGLFLYMWAAKKFGRKVGLLILTFYAFYPDILAHGRFVTTDVAAALGFVVAIYFFDRVICKVTWQNILWAALAFALAQLLKFSAFLLFAIFLILVIIKAWQERKEIGKFIWALWKYFKAYFWVCLLAVVFVWIVYIPFTWNTPPAVEHKVIESNLLDDPRTLPLRNFEHHFENNPITRGLGHYFLGLMLVIGRVEGGNNTFILGHLSDKGIPWYFPVAWLLKTPIPIILLVLWSLITMAFYWPKEREKRWQLAVITIPIIVYWAFTLRGQLNIGTRHLIPTVPFVLLLIGATIVPLINGKKIWPKVLIGALTIYMITSTLINYPSFISYFNEFTPKSERYKRLIDSSLDWGQDLLRLKKYTDDNNITDIKIDYFGGSKREYYFPNSTGWYSGNGPTTGWLAVSATFYQLSKLVGPKENKWSYGWLDAYKPAAIIGNSILVFHITPQDFIDHPPISPYPITNLERPKS